MRLRCVGRFFNALPLQITRPKKTNCDPDDSSLREYRVRERRERERERERSFRAEYYDCHTRKPLEVFL